MVYHALSDQVKQQKATARHNSRMRAAIDEYRQQELKPNAVDRLSYRAVADKHDVSKSTLQRLVNGGISMSAFNTSKQRLTPAEERIVINFCLESADRGFPLTVTNVYKCADNILTVRLGDEHSPLGHNWVNNFLTRYRDELQTHWSKPLDTQRGQALNPTNVKLWFDMVKEHIVDTKVLPRNVYGMDESGFPSSDQGTQRVIGRRGTKTQHAQGSAERENVTAIITICADGTVLKPSIIFKGQNVMKKWGDNNVSEASISASANGWTDGGIALEWLEVCFDAQTKEKAAGAPRVLLMDGHSSHYTPELLKYAQDDNIIILGYPPHCTHALQGLDVVCFARMKETWKEEIRKFEDLHRSKVTKGDFAEVFGNAFHKAITLPTILAAFEKTGIHPYNPDVITPRMMKASKPSSLIGSLPIPMPSPVRAVMMAFNARGYTTADLDPDNFCIPNPLPEPTTPTTPPRIPQPIAGTLPALYYTPSSRMRMMASALASTASGSFLVGNPRITSANTIASPVYGRPMTLPEPDWSLIHQPPATRSPSKAELKALNAKLTLSLEQSHAHILARNSVIEGSNAQLAVQSIFNSRLNEALNTKEHKKATDRTQLLFPGGGPRVLTDPMFIQKVTDDKAARLAKVAAQAEGVKKRSRAKRMKAAIEMAWEQMGVDHQAAITAYDAECVVLLAQGVAKKHLPKKPKKGIKPKEVELSESEPEIEGDDETDEDE